MSVDALRSAYEASRFAVLSSSRDVGPGCCRYCGAWWRKWNGSKLDGHAKCYVTEGFKHELDAWLRAHPQRTYQIAAAALGVTVSVVLSWVGPVAKARKTMAA